MSRSPKKEARIAGQKTYVTGVPCKAGHLAPRFTSDSSCIECRRLKSERWRIDHPEETRRIQNKCNEKRRESQREYRQRPDVAERARATQKAWVSANRDKARLYSSRWKERNEEVRKAYLNRPDVKARMNATSQRWAKENRDRVSLWAKKHPEKRRAISGRRYAKKRLVCVSWADQEKIAAIYAEAERLTRETGIPHEVDHIYPIQGKTVTGLHHEKNLRVVPRFVNRSKGNKMPEEAAL